jgi:uncharacterized membrane protein YkvA (DUF1232 family)
MTESVEFNDEGYWAKIKSSAAAAGREVIHKGYCLYFAYCDPITPKWAKAVIAGALAYFVLPADAIPDFLPAIGYTDDLAALTAAVATVAAHISPEHKQQADERTREWLGD